MSHENMYVAEKELCKGTLIELEKLNDVKGVGRNKRKERKPPPRTETVLECRGGVMARVVVNSEASTSTHDPTAPMVAGGAELLAGLSEAERSALLGDDNDRGADSLSASDFHRPSLPQVQQQADEPTRVGRAPPPRDA